MKTLVVYDSVYGNTEIVARAIGDAIGAEVPVLRLDQVQVSDVESADLLVIGSPTHGSMATEAMQGLVAKIGAPAREGARLATFDTRLTWGFLRRYGYAADKIEDALKAKGWTVAGDQGGFFVRGLRKGPLKKGEVERATAWATELVEGLAGEEPS
jgi:flavodoxin